MANRINETSSCCLHSSKLLLLEDDIVRDVLGQYSSSFVDRDMATVTEVSSVCVLVVSSIILIISLRGLESPLIFAIGVIFLLDVLCV